MEINLLSSTSAAAGFDAPLDMLSACHARIEKQCATLRRLVRHLDEHGADQDARQAAANVMRYFDTAGRDHHADEEHDLFPALLESMAGSDPVCLRDITQALTHDHRELAAVWQALRPQLGRVVRGEADALDAAAVDEFVDHHTQHIAREESELLPMAKRLLSDEQLQEIGKAMRARRGV
ncbi:hemerythrin domain-containing protein [Thiomonas arsenitoxydans]|jgi:hemerythrin-like domain-containing protein|uniref:hemerythrin domain-containing protein n=1 Tax=Thiomonas arsenitoxydans (strain DSM 22701 / CIP 110005 / 3As) TaxID=426114 RepID=UPI001AC5C09A|nr:hemerythrin domain-containing protein [Thiomonas arsenitoxydans]MBN8777457.1 hemerythrin domain-containing protein [Thiomonas arsenitoxydans]